MPAGARHGSAMSRTALRLAVLLFCCITIAGCAGTATESTPAQIVLTGGADTDVFTVIAAAANAIEREYAEPVATSDLTRAAATGMGLVQSGRSRERMVQGAIEAMLATLKGNNYISDPRAETADLREKGGRTGLLLQRSGDRIVSTGTDRRTAAERAGIRPDWTLLRIDDRPVDDLTRHALYARLNGRSGSTVRLEWDVPGRGRVITELVREILSPPPVAPDACETRPVLNMRAIRAETRTAILSHDRNCPLATMEAVVIDLRNSSGGALSHVVEVSSLFISSGRLFSVANREEVTRFAAQGHRGLITPDVPLIVLTNRATSSGAELIARALQFLAGAIVVGDRTAGLDEIHTVVPLQGTRNVLHLWSGRALFADGQPASVGVTPNIALSDDPATPEDEVIEALPLLVEEWRRLRRS